MLKKLGLQCGCSLKYSITLSCLLPLIFLSGCAFLRTPFATKLGDIKETKADVAGVITVSDPQLYARESLLNDRREELEYLDRLLLESERIEIGSDINRSLSDVFALRIQAAGGFDPVLGDENRLRKQNREVEFALEQKKSEYALQQYDELIELQTEVRVLKDEQDTLHSKINSADTRLRELERTKSQAESEKNSKVILRDAENAKADAERNVERIATLQGEINSLQEKLSNVDNELFSVTSKKSNMEADKAVIDKKIESREARVTTLETAFGAKPGSGISDTGTAYGSAATGSQTSTSALEARISKLADFFKVKASDDSSTKDVKSAQFPQQSKTSTTKSPIDTFRDRQAYRDELRAAIAEARLNDLHDYVGNALFRLNFQTSIAPGKYKNKFGVASIQMKRPSVSGQWIDAIYTSWLRQIIVHVNRSNFDLLTFCSTSQDKIESQVVSTYMALGHELNLFRLVKVDFTKTVGLYSNDEINPEKIDVFFAVEPGFRDDFARFLSILRGKINPSAADSNALSALKPWIIQNLSAIEYAVGESSCRAGSKTEELKKVLNEMRSTLFGLDKEGYTVGEYSERASGALIKPPNPFIAQIAVADKNDKQKFLLKGRMQAFTASPIELGQAISTVANSARSLELALAAAADLKEQGVAASGSFALMRDSVGLIESLERIPRIVGFTDHAVRPDDTAGKLTVPSYGESLNAIDSTDPVFGWVFGPKARLDTNKNKIVMEQTLSGHRTSVEMSVPGWWPYVTLRVNSFWAGNFNERSGLDFKPKKTIETSVERRLNLSIPTYSVDFLGLTAFLVGDHGPRSSVFRQPTIRSINPNGVSVCADKIDISIMGDNLWRNADVFFGGVRASKVTIMPDMRGVTATVNVRALLPSVDRRSFEMRDTMAQIPIQVATRDGSVSDWSLSLYGRPNEAGRIECSSVNSIGLKAESVDFVFPEMSITDVSPNPLLACGQESTIFVELSQPAPASKSGNFPGSLGGIPIDFEVVERGNVLQGKVGKMAAFFSSIVGQEIPLAITVARKLLTRNIFLKGCSSASGSALISMDAPLGVNRNWIDGSSKTELTLKPTLAMAIPTKGNEVGYRLHSPSFETPWTRIAATAVPDKGMIIAELPVIAGSEFENGSKLELALFWSDDSSQGEIRGNELVVYYQNPAARTADVTVVGNTPGKNYPDKIKLDLPVAWDHAFPKLTNYGVVATVTLESNEKLVSEFASLTTLNNTDNNISLPLQFKRLDKISKAIDGNENVTMKIEIRRDINTAVLPESSPLFPKEIQLSNRE